MLVFGHMDNIRRRMAMRLPGHAVDDVASDVVVRAIASAFDGTSAGEFHSWLSTICRRAIADFYRSRARRIRADPLVAEGDDGGRYVMIQWSSPAIVRSRRGW